jgi:hypothetical protein
MRSPYVPVEPISNMAGVPIRRKSGHKDTDTQKHIKTETEVRVICLHGRIANNQRYRKRQGWILP